MRFVVNDSFTIDRDIAVGFRNHQGNSFLPTDGNYYVSREMINRNTQVTSAVYFFHDKSSNTYKYNNLLSVFSIQFK